MSYDHNLGVVANIDAVILDMDGLMLDTEYIYKRAWQRAAADLGFDLDDVFYLTLVGRDNADGEAALVQRFGAQFPVVPFREQWAWLWRDHVVAHGIPTKPGLHEFLTLLDVQRIPFAVATSSAHEYATVSLRAAGVHGRVTRLVTGDQVERGKPAPDIYLEAARRLNARPSCCIALEDSDAGTLAAASAGMSALLIPDLQAPSEPARRAALRVLTSLHDAVDFVSGLLQARGQAG